MKQFFGTLFVIFALIVLIAIVRPSCTDEETARRVLRQQGYTNVEITGYRPFMGSDDDYYSTGFKATAPNGESVTGAVTSSPMKGATLRLD